MNKKYSTIKKFLLCAIAIVMALMVGIAGIYGYKGYKLYSDTIREKPISEMYERIKEIEYFTSYDELPQIYIDAVISAEDKRFMSHNGVDLLAMCRAAYNDIRTMSFIEGGSTITQQLAKNALFSQDKNFTRKFAEIFAAISIEKEYSKEEIFEMYANYIYFGEGYYGIGEASNGYFEKCPSDLSDWQAVMLAGLPNTPSVYSPRENPELSIKRMAVVLRRMVACCKITQNESDSLYRQALLAYDIN